MNTLIPAEPMTVSTELLFTLLFLPGEDFSPYLAMQRQHDVGAEAAA